MYFVDRSVVEHFQYIRYEPHKVFFFEFVQSSIWKNPSIDDDWDLKNGDVPGLFEFGETRDRLDGQIRRSRVEGFVRSDVRDFC